MPNNVYTDEKVTVTFDHQTVVLDNGSVHIDSNEKKRAEIAIDRFPIAEPEIPLLENLRDIFNGKIIGAGGGGLPGSRGGAPGGPTEMPDETMTPERGEPVDGDRGSRPGGIVRIWDGNNRLRTTITAHATIHRSPDGHPRAVLSSDGGIAILSKDQRTRCTIGTDGTILLFDEDPNNGLPAIIIDANEGDIKLPNGDCAEEFELHPNATARPGEVMCIDPTGGAVPCASECCTRVIGVVSGLGKHRPALLLDHHPGSTRRAPVALFGKVMCAASAELGPICGGDLLVSSRRAGHVQSWRGSGAPPPGAVLGKALTALNSSVGTIEMLVFPR